MNLCWEAKKIRWKKEKKRNEERENRKHSLFCVACHTNGEIGFPPHSGSVTSMCVQQFNMHDNSWVLNYIYHFGRAKWSCDLSVNRIFFEWLSNQFLVILWIKFDSLMLFFRRKYFLKQKWWALLHPFNGADFLKIVILKNFRTTKAVVRKSKSI